MAEPMSDAPGNAVIFVFLDGVGLGPPDPVENPFTTADTSFIARILGGQLVADTPPRTAPNLVYGQLDATLGHEGLPQSATGQTALLTGTNAADLMNGHYGPWPGPTLRAELARGNLFHTAQAAPGAQGAALANAYPPRYFEHARGRRLRLNAMAAAAVAADVPQRDLAYYERGEAIAVDLKGTYFQSLGHRGTDPADSAANLLKLARGTTLTVLDVWLTDTLGHARDHAGAVELIERLDAFLEALAADLGEATLLLTSDHGNLEDLGTKTHTRNPVPLLALGKGAHAFRDSASLLDVAPAVRSLWRSGAEDDDGGLVPGADQQQH